MTFLLLALASWWAWETLVSSLPFRIPARLAPGVVFLLALLGLHLSPVLVTAAAAAGVVALLHLLVVQFGSAPEPWTLRLPQRKTASARRSHIPVIP